MVPLRPLAALCLLGLARAYNNGVSRTPPLGWNTWCTYGGCAQPSLDPALRNPTHDWCNAAEIISVAEAMASNGMKALGWSYINLVRRTHQHSCAPRAQPRSSYCKRA